MSGKSQKVLDRWPDIPYKPSMTNEHVGHIIREITIREKICADGSRRIEGIRSISIGPDGSLLSESDALVIGARLLVEPKPLCILGHPCSTELHGHFEGWPSMYLRKG